MIESNHKVESTAKLVELEPLCIEEATKPTVTYDSSVGLVVSYAEEGNTEDRSYSLLDDDRRGWGKSINNFCFPPHLPQEVQLLRWENIAVPSCYLTVGILQGTFRPLLNVWPLDLGATEAQQTTMMIISTLPATFKILYGFWSDNVPMFGYRRKPYMALGWLLCSTMMAALISSLNGTIHDETVVKKSPSMQWLGAVFFFYGCGLWISDVMADSMVAQKTRSEPDNFRGHLQSTCYACRFFGQMMAAPVSSYLYSAHGPETVLRVLFIIPLLTIPLIVVMAEEQLVPPSTLAQCQEIWKTVCSRSVWQPMAFCYIFNLLQVPNVAWRQFLKTNLHFTAANLNALLVVSYAFLYLGTVVYKYFFLHTSWRRIYMVSMAVNFVLSALQLLLIQNRTGGLSPFWFALGDDAMAEFILGIQFLPTAILMVNLCPPGSEGASYAMFTTCTLATCPPALDLMWVFC